jgi:NADH-quinone oxidoreductase subunit N
MSFCFKLGVFPAYFHIPDVYEVASSSVIIFLSTIIKASCFFLLVKIYLNLNLVLVKNLFFIIGLISMIIGAILAFKSSNIKRFLGYTSINQFGFFFICLSTQSINIIFLNFIYFFLYNLFLIVILGSYLILPIYKSLQISFLFEDL